MPSMLDRFAILRLCEHKQSIVDFKLGETSTPLSLETSEDNRAAAQRLVQQARRSLDIYSRDLDKAIYDAPTFLDAVRALALNAKQGAVRILVNVSSRAVIYGHRLIPLCQRLTSFIEIRRPPEEYRDYKEAFMVVDRLGYLQRKLADRYEGTAYINAGHAARRMLTFFEVFGTRAS